MQITIERNHLLKALGHIQRVVERKNTYPILANVLLRAEDDRLWLRATDLDIEITESVPATVVANGTTTVSAHKIYEIVRKLGESAEVTIKVSDDNVVLSSGRSRFNLAVLSADSFPDLKSGDMPYKFTLSSKELADLIDRTGFAASNEETRYYLNGIYLHTVEAETGTVLRAVATDGHRLARMQVPAPEGTEGMPGIIIPRKTVSEIQKLLDDASDDVTLETSESKIRLTTGDVTVLSKLIEGNFPDYERVTPKNNDKCMVIDRQSFAAAIDRVSTIASDRGGKAIRLKSSQGMLELLVTNPDHGNASEEMSVDFDVEDFEIGFNARYLLDIVSQIRTDDAEFWFAEPGSPSLIHEREASRDALYVLMPMRF